MSLPRPFPNHDQHQSSPAQSQRYSYTISSQQPRDIVSPPPQYYSPSPVLEPPSPVAHGARSNYNRPYSPPRNTTAHDDPPSPVSSYRPTSSQSRPYSRNGRSVEIPRRPVPTSPIAGGSPPRPPVHRQIPNRDSYRPQSLVTPGMDNYSDRAQGGGLNRVAHDVAERYPRESGVEASRNMPHDASQGYFPADYDHTTDVGPYGQHYSSSSYPPENASHGSNLPMVGYSAAPGASTPAAYSPDLRANRYSGQHLAGQGYSPPSQHSVGPYGNYGGSPYHSTPALNAGVGGDEIIPGNIADDDDDGFMPEPKRRSFLPMHKDRSRESMGKAPVVTTAGVAGAAAGARNTGSGSYNPVAPDDVGASRAEKSEWLSRQTSGNHKMKWIIGSLIAFVVVAAIVGGVVGGVLASKSHHGSGNTNNAADDTAANGDLGLNSPEIQSLLNNPNLHKVFPGMDYTPWGTQYPLCFTYPPSQNNVTRDMAVLSQLTNTVRLYGTDCNQTEMVLHAIDRLHLTDMKVWLGVWIDPNMTTTDRQLDQMYKILASVPDISIFKGAIIGNEALYRAGVDKSQSEQTLIQYLTDVKSNFSSLNYDLPVATSDLGDNWNAQLAEVSDYVMANIHPFFAGVDVDTAAAWTWDFWQSHDVALTAGMTGVKQLISETGWPSDGGTDCGNEQNVCAPGQTGSVASVDNMNKFMEEWVCQALANGTDYFWFEAFDEPWKVVYNTPGKDWEDKWGLMDPGRNLKDGLKIPDCGGQTV